MYNVNNRKIISRISAISVAVLMAAQCFTAFADTADKLGDVNFDGKINASDVVSVAAHIRGLKTLDSRGAAAADVNSDSKVNAADITMIAAHCKGIKSLSKKEISDEKVKLPELFGLTEEQAVAALKEAGLNCLIDYDFSSTETGQVCSYNAEYRDGFWPKGSYVPVCISLGEYEGPRMSEDESPYPYPKTKQSKLEVPVPEVLSGPYTFNIYSGGDVLYTNTADDISEVKKITFDIDACNKDRYAIYAKNNNSKDNELIRYATYEFDYDSETWALVGGLNFEGLGVSTVELPELFGLTEEQAVKALNEAGLNCRIGYDFSSTEKGQVCSYCAVYEDGCWPKGSYVPVCISLGEYEGPRMSEDESPYPYPKTKESKLEVPVPEGLDGSYTFNIYRNNYTNEVEYTNTVNDLNSVKSITFDVEACSKGRFVIYAKNNNSKGNELIRYATYEFDYDSETWALVGVLNTDGLK